MKRSSHDVAFLSVLTVLIFVIPGRGLFEKLVSRGALWRTFQDNLADLGLTTRELERLRSEFHSAARSEGPLTD